ERRLSTCSNVPAESLDIDFDFFRVTEYSLIQDSCGHGRQRGGLGICRRYEILEDGVQFAQYGDRFRFPPEGLAGGTPGATAACTIDRDGAVLPVKTKDAAEL